MNKITLGIVAAVFSASANASWTIMDVGESIFAFSINDSGQITGRVDVNNSASGYAFITDANGLNMRNIGTLGISSTGNDINNLGQVVGHYMTENGDFLPFVTGPNGNGMADPGILTGSNTALYGINESGQIIGSYSLNNDGRSFIADADSTNINDIGSLAGLSTHAVSLNNSGQVVGYSLGSDGRDHAFITNNDGTGLKDLGTFDPKYYKTSIAYDINDSGQTAGYSSMDNSFWAQAFITGADGTGITSIGTLGGTYSAATAINNAGQVIGLSSAEFGGFEHSFIYANGGMTDLTLLPEVVNAGWTDIYVSDINNNGQITGWGFMENDPGNAHSFLLSFTADTVFTPQDLYIPPVPEPSTYLMLLAGLGFLGFVARRNS
ncbi:putative secreted protein with PEP-CTERM sorting signal [Nitrosomonas ureae]|uniref:HAF repeat-containing PEP-CTERM protein n=1 Tax=Nitrosomonas ureae TaxID=44577 RepID=UPI000D75F977|nr:HAF repeat-containing PEP-CTERM protein [Nitrosomonas ureae]PXX14761.1 putative secreted protein with PEP-CTERM sorting signal [Nitrosomonas ureae]